MGLLNLSSKVKTYYLPRLNQKPSKCESVSLSTSDKPESKSVMPVGNSTASSTESSQTDKCHPTKPSVAVTTPSTPFSPKLVPASTSHEPFSSISSQPSSTKSEPVPTDNSSTQNS